MFIVTVGGKFNDIDGFGCAIAYAELLRKEGKEAKAVFVGPFNNSVTRMALEAGGQFETDYKPSAEDQFVHVDISDGKYFAFPDKDESKIFEIYDHHYGFEEYWKERLGERSHIEHLGAAGTLIWEEFKKRGFENDISPASADLLALAILQNTLNFTSTETSDRDVQAFAELKAHISLSGDWEKRYFREITEGTESAFQEALRNDTKVIDNFLGQQTLIFSQLEIFEDPKVFFGRHKTEIDAYWAELQSKRCLINIADIISKTSLLYSDDARWLHESIKSLFPSVLESSDGYIVIPLHQRKQILKLLQK